MSGLMNSKRKFSKLRMYLWHGICKTSMKTKRKKKILPRMFRNLLVKIKKRRKHQSLRMAKNHSKL